MIINNFDIAVIAMLLPLFAQADGNQLEGNSLELLVHKKPTTGCCNKWMKDIEDDRIVAHLKDSFALKGQVLSTFIYQLPSEKHTCTIVLFVLYMTVVVLRMKINDRIKPDNMHTLFSDEPSQD